MLILNPRAVKFGPAVWDEVLAVAVDRHASRIIRQHGDLGPHTMIVDVPGQEVRIRIVRSISRDDIDVPRPGDLGTLTLYTAPAGNELRRRRVSCTAVVTGVAHELTATRATRTVTLEAVSSDGAADPIAIADAPGAAA
ncbi:MAG: hypothetical protein IT437_01700 [Phycisphaerales bacterium]|nr:hypothetical protein [Phycisphaerales bacterium]